MQIHVTDIDHFKPVSTALDIFDAIIETSGKDELKFKMPPYEYEYNLMPFDILSGDSEMRESLISRTDPEIEKARWAGDIEKFVKEFRQIAVYPE